MIRVIQGLSEGDYPVITCIRSSIFLSVGTENVINISFREGPIMPDVCFGQHFMDRLHDGIFSGQLELALTVIFADDTHHDILV